VTPRTRAWGALELAALFAGYVAFTWLLLPAYRAPSAVIAIVLASVAGGAWVVFVSPVLVHGDPAEERGLGPWRTLWVRTDNLARSARLFALLAAAASVLLVVLALARSPETLASLRPGRFLVELGWYLPLALVQDLALVFVLVRLGALFAGAGGIRAGLAATGTAAALFALVHVPNATMVALAASFALAAGTAFRSRPNFLALVLCHTWSGAALRCLTDLNTRVGPFASCPDVRVARDLTRVLREYLLSLFATG
jgi:hypothetical protein